jgi:hypothetical protein
MSAAAIVCAGAIASDAAAQGVAWQQLDAQGWDCFVPPPRPDLVACYNPGLGRPFLGSPRPTYSVLVFSSSSGEFLNTAHLIRADLYHGQPCGTESYNFLARIGYWECVHP